MSLSGKDKPRALDPESWYGPPVIIYRPGDPGFAERAAECTFIQDISNVSKGAVFCFDLEEKQRRIRREKREALAN